MFPITSQQVLLRGGDLLLLHSAARYHWTHGIAAVRAERYSGSMPPVHDVQALDSTFGWRSEEPRHDSPAETLRPCSSQNIRIKKRHFPDQPCEEGGIGCKSETHGNEVRRKLPHPGVYRPPSEDSSLPFGHLSADDWLPAWRLCTSPSRVPLPPPPRQTLATAADGVGATPGDGIAEVTALSSPEEAAAQEAPAISPPVDFLWDSSDDDERLAPSLVVVRGTRLSVTFRRLCPGITLETPAG